MNFIQEYMSLVLMLYVPFYAILARISFIGINKFNYTELLVVFLYVQAQISITTSIISVIASCFGVTQGVLGLFTLPLMILYAGYCLQRLYKLNFANMLLRTLLFMALLGILFVILSIVMAAVMFFNGTLEQMIEAQKAASGN